MWSRVETWFSRWPLIYRVLPPLIWMLLIFWLSSRPTLPHAPGPLDRWLKKGAHMAEYAVLLLLWWRTLASRPTRFSPLSLAWILTVLYAVSDEFHQTFVPGRNGNLLDVIVDALGASLAAFGLRLTMRK